MSHEDSDALRLKNEVIRLIRAVEAAWDRVGEQVGPLLIMDENAPETSIPLAECKVLSDALCRAIADYTLHVRFESGPVRYRGRIYHPVLEGSGPHAYTLIVDPKEVVDIADEPRIADSDDDAEYMGELWDDVVQKIAAYEAIRREDPYGGEWPDTEDDRSDRQIAYDDASFDLAKALCMYDLASDVPNGAVFYQGVIYAYFQEPRAAVGLMRTVRISAGRIAGPPRKDGGE